MEYNSEKEIEKLCTENKIVFVDEFGEFQGLKLAGLLPLVHNELDEFLKRENIKNGFYILIIRNPETKEEYPLRINYSGKEIKENGNKNKPSSIFTRLAQADAFIEQQPIFYDKTNLWWWWNKEKTCWEITDEINLLNMIEKEISLDIVNSKNRAEIIHALQQRGRLNVPKEVKESWVQFGKTIYDIETGETFEATPEYFITNPIQWKMGREEKTPALDILLESWVGKEHIQELYELLAFCIVPSYFIHRLFCLIGSGANGKSTFLKVLTNFIGIENTTASSLFLIMNNRFESSKLLKKSCCLIGETNFTTISNTDLLKKLTGGDLIRAEFKGKACFDFRNYAKLIMATNSLPQTADKTEGFYRRWKIITFPNKFDREMEVLHFITKEEYQNLALKCFNIAKRLWFNRSFTNEGDFEERKKKFEDMSNPLMLFIKENYEKDIQKETFLTEFCEDLNEFLVERGFRTLTNKTISNQLRNEGFEIKNITKEGITGRRIIGLINKGIVTNNRNNINNDSLISSIGKKTNEDIVIPVISVISKEKSLDNFTHEFAHVNLNSHTNINSCEYMIEKNNPFLIIKKGEVVELQPKIGEKFSKNDFGDNAEMIIEILLNDGTLKKVQKEETKEEFLKKLNEYGF